jgi:hypothetical protein
MKTHTCEYIYYFLSPPKYPTDLTIRRCKTCNKLQVLKNTNFWVNFNLHKSE